MKSSDYFSEWLSDEKVELKLSTYEATTNYINGHIIPWFDENAPVLENIKPRDIQNYINFKLNGGRLDGKCGGLSRVSVSKHLSIMKQALNKAVIYDYISANPAACIRMKRAKSVYTKRIVMLSTEEAQRLVEAFKGHYLYEAVVLSLYYGLRKEEVVGLRWSAIDFDNNVIRIEHTVVKSLTIEESDEMKTNSSYAIFPMLPGIREMLLSMKENKSPYTDYLFTNREHTRYIRPDVMTRAFQRHLLKAGFEKMRFHDLRHSTASILFDKGTPIDEVRIWLRHEDIETTLNIYTHWSSRKVKQISDKIAGIINIS
ncbi:MAG: site-specific integrase [Oscillospiraceae bacterium]|nr:site-specific integrase [Oscillospiraceae bacterium]